MKLPKLNSAYIPVFLAALAQGVMWVGVFSLIHSGPLAYIGGIPAGLAIVWIITRSANILPRVQAKRARNAGWFFLGLVIVVEPVVLGVVNWWFMPANFQTLFASYLVAGGASLVITLVLVMGALVDRSLVPAQSVAPATETAARPKKSKKSAEKSEEVQTPVAQSVAVVQESDALKVTYPHPCGVNGCTYPIKSAQSVGGHMKAKHPAALGIFQPVTQDKAAKQ